MYRVTVQDSDWSATVWMGESFDIAVSQFQLTMVTEHTRKITLERCSNG